MKLYDFIKLIQMIVIVLIFFAGRTGLGIVPNYFPLYVSFLGISFLVLSLLVAKKKKLLISTPLYIFTLSCFVLFLLCGVYLEVSGYGVKKFLEIFFYVLVLILIIDNCIENKEDFNKLVKVIYFISFLMAGFALMLGFINNTIFTERLTFLGSGSNTFSRMMFFGLIANIYTVTVERKGKLTLLTLWIFLSAILFSGARQTILGTIILVTIYILMIVSSKRKLNLNFKIKYLKLISILVIPIFFLWPFIEKSIYFQRFLLLFMGNQGDSVNVRFWLIEQAVLYGKESYLFGNGTGAFLVEFPKYIYPHNIFAEVFMENGVLGLTLLSLLITTPLYMSLKGFRNNNFISLNINKSLFIMFLFSLFTAQISGDLFDNRWIFYFGFLLVKFNKIKKVDISNEKENTNVRFS